MENPYKIFFKGDIIVDDLNYDETKASRGLLHYVNRRKIQLKNFKLVKRPLINWMKLIINKIK